MMRSFSIALIILHDSIISILFYHFFKKSFQEVLYCCFYESCFPVLASLFSVSVLFLALPWSDSSA